MITRASNCVLEPSRALEWRGESASSVHPLTRPAPQVRYSFVIIPVNYSLAAVNFFVGSTGLTQLYRIWDWRRKNPVAAAAQK
jgi:hypothetical protein